MKIESKTFEIEIPFPAKEAPIWAPKSDRWYQLDQPGYSLPQAYSILKSNLGAPPDLIYLASPTASNATDRDFAASGASSPSKFVHTLPNIRAVSLLQVMEWSGPLLCLQNDPRTLESAQEEAEIAFEADKALSRIWIVSFSPRDSRVIFQILKRN